MVAPGLPCPVMHFNMNLCAAAATAQGAETAVRVRRGTEELWFTKEKLNHECVCSKKSLSLYKMPEWTAVRGVGRL